MPDIWIMTTDNSNRFEYPRAFYSKNDAEEMISTFADEWNQPVIEIPGGWRVDAKPNKWSIFMIKTHIELL